MCGRQTVWRSSKFMIEFEEGETVWEGWTTGQTWNGWACPVFPKEVADAMAAASNGTLVFDSANDVYTFDDGTYPGEPPTVFEAFEIETSGGTRKVWPVGAWYWTWQEAA